MASDTHLAFSVDGLKAVLHKHAEQLADRLRYELQTASIALRDDIISRRARAVMEDIEYDLFRLSESRKVSGEKPAVQDSSIAACARTEFRTRNFSNGVNAILRASQQNHNEAGTAPCEGIGRHDMQGVNSPRHGESRNPQQPARQIWGSRTTKAPTHSGAEGSTPDLASEVGDTLATSQRNHVSQTSQREPESQQSLTPTTSSVSSGLDQEASPLAESIQASTGRSSTGHDYSTSNRGYNPTALQMGQCEVVRGHHKDDLVPCSTPRPRSSLSQQPSQRQGFEASEQQATAGQASSSRALQPWFRDDLLVLSTARSSPHEMCLTEVVGDDGSIRLDLSGPDWEHPGRILLRYGKEGRPMFHELGAVMEETTSPPMKDIVLDRENRDTLRVLAQALVMMLSRKTELRELWIEGNRSRVRRLNDHDYSSEIDPRPRLDKIAIPWAVRRLRTVALRPSDRVPGLAFGGTEQPTVARRLVLARGPRRHTDREDSESSNRMYIDVVSGMPTTKLPQDVVLPKTQDTLLRLSRFIASIPTDGRDCPLPELRNAGGKRKESDSPS